ncbi:hypothetical protein GCM10018773_19970 [Streptomyces candidus]|nr:hypothetical protein GCM10018773_19970 [Streptomyces candidus]
MYVGWRGAGWEVRVPWGAAPLPARSAPGGGPAAQEGYGTVGAAPPPKGATGGGPA